MRKKLAIFILIFLFSIGVTHAQSSFWVGSLFNDTLGEKVPNILELDWSSTGSGNGQGIGQAGTSLTVGQTFNFRYQSILINVSDPSGQPVDFPGLGLDFEYTAVALIPEQISTSSPGPPEKATFTTLTGGNFYIYHDSSPNASTRTGFGFDDGELVLSGTVESGQPILFTFYPSTGIGLASVTLNGKVTFANPSFIDPSVSVVALRFESTVNYPPGNSTTSAFFDGRAGQGNFSTYTVTDNDLQLKVDGSSKFLEGSSCIDIIKEVSVDGGITWFDANTVEEAPGTNDGVQYRFTVSNCGSTDLTNVIVTDPALGITEDAGTVIFVGDLPVGGSDVVLPAANYSQLNVPGRCDDVPPPGSGDPNKFNEATVVGNVADTDQTVTDSDPAWVKCICLDIEKLVSVDGGLTFEDADQCFDPAAPVADGAVEYKLVVTNCGAVTLNNLNVVDPLLGVNEYVGSILPGEEKSWTREELPAVLNLPDFCATFNENLDENGNLLNTATASATALDGTYSLTDEDTACVTCSCSGTIGDYVWEDANQNGIQDDGEQPLANVVVNISGPDGFSSSMMTNAAGFYQFTDLCPGTYEVTVETPAGYLPTPVCSADQGIEGDANCSPQTVVSNNDTNNTIDFGFYKDCKGVVGDYVWEDANQNGIQDDGEQPLANVVVNISGPDGFSSSMMTNAAGFYQFTDLCPGTYEVTVETPAGYLPTPVCSADQGIEGDANCSPQTVVSNNDTNNTIDFAFYTLAVKIDVEKYVRVCTVTPEETDPGCAFHHHKHRDGDDHVKECDYNRDGKCDTGDDNYCDKNSYSCWNYDKYHCDYDHDGDCDSSDKSICDKNRDGSCNYHDKKSCFSHGDDEEENNFCDHDHDGDCDDAESGYQCTDWLDADDPTGPITPVCTEGNVSSCGKVYFQFVITNDGATPLSNITLTDSFYDVSSCELPASLISGESYTCEIGPLAPEAGQHTNTAIATGSYIGTEVTDSDDANYFGGTVEVGCVRSPGYWKNHSDAWPVESITIGGLEYTVEQAIGIMDKPVTKDKTYTMFPTLVAAKLDVLMGAESGCIDETITAADNWMNQYPVGSGVKGYSDAWKTGEPLSQKFDQYVNGQLCAAACDGNVPPTPFPSKPRIDIQKYTNGYDADVAPGPYVKVGESIEWRYVVKNKGDVALSEITVTDDKVDSITCPGSSLQPDESMTCSVTGIAIYGQYVNTGCVKGYTADGVKVSDCDKSHYYGTKTQSGCGTGTSGYWSKHSGAWPLWSVTVGGTSYSKDKAMWLISKSGFTDKTYAMFSALVAAKLNVKTGTNSDCISDTINAAEAWMKTYSLGCGVKENSTAWTSSGKSLYQKLITYNNGLLCAPHRDSITTNYTSWWGTEKKNLVCSDED